MRLINTITLSLEEFWTDDIPPYAILSHTWGEDEIAFQDMQRPEIAAHKMAWGKIRNACRLAAANGFSFIWIDTCCIDKSNLAEHSEAINSMYGWYKRAGQCIAYLVDVADDMSLFDRSRWFTRGWTLIELIAPARVDFYDSNWRHLGSRSELVSKISDITGIDPFVLAGGDVNKVRVARRMYWASRRQTRRREDKAYCLMGLFDVHMPIIYGEGESAFKRLQEEIYISTNDESIFAWNGGIDDPRLATRPIVGDIMERWRMRGLLAKSPADFARCGAIFPPLGVKGVEESHDDLEESLWDSTSTTSTLVQSSADQQGNPALSRAISFFEDDPKLFLILQAAMQRPGVGLDRFRRILIGILRFFAVELAQEAEDKDQQSSANFIRKYRLVIGSTITQRVAEAALKPIELEQVPFGDENAKTDVNEDADDDEILGQEREEPDDGEDDSRAENPVEVDVQFNDITTFIRSSKAFEQMFTRLTDLACPSFRSRATECAEKWLRSKLPESDDFEHRDAMRSRMHLIISELHYSKPESLFIDERGKLSQFERFQLKLESLTGESWSWWPFTRPRPELGQGESRLGWTCSCGDARWEAVPDEFAQRLALLAKKFPLANSSPLPTIPAPTWNPTAHASSSPGKSSASYGLPNRPDHDSTRRMANSPLPVLENQTGGQGPVTARFIFLVAKFGRYTLDELPSLYLDTIGFGTELRSVYLRRKGFWLSKLSPYGFSHCDFAKFEKFRRNGYAHRGYSLPDLRLKQYFYSPTSHEPPISPEEFKDIYQHVSRRPLSPWAVLPLRKMDNHDLASDTVNRIPQRFWNFNKHANEREDFWGIYICERRSAFMTCVYILLSLAPFIGFSLLYSLGFVSGDIQNATTPLALSLTALGLFLGSMIKQ